MSTFPEVVPLAPGPSEPCTSENWRVLFDRKCRPYWRRIGWWCVGIPSWAFVMGGPRPWEDAYVMAVLTITTGAGLRSVALCLAATLFWASGPSVQLPTYWLCFTPFVW